MDDTKCGMAHGDPQQDADDTVVMILNRNAKISRAEYLRLTEQFKSRIAILDPSRVYRCDQICGFRFWDLLTTGLKKKAGMVMAIEVEHSRLGLIVVPREHASIHYRLK